MFVAFDLQTHKNIINFDTVCEFTVHYREEEPKMVIFINDSSEPWCWTFVNKEALEQTYNDIVMGLYKKDTFVSIPADRLA